MAKYSEDKEAIYKPKFIYFAVKDEFNEVLDYIDETKKLHELDMITYDCNILEVNNILYL